MIPAAKSKPVVLLAEDSEDDAYFFQRAFRKAAINCSLVRACDGKAAIDLLRRESSENGFLPFLLFLDLKLPVMSGFEVLEWLRTWELGQQVKVIVLSGSNDQNDRSRAATLGAADYLVKPISADLLKARISRELPQSLPMVEATD